MKTEKLFKIACRIMTGRVVSRPDILKLTLGFLLGILLGSLLWGCHEKKPPEPIPATTVTDRWSTIGRLDSTSFLVAIYDDSVFIELEGFDIDTLSWSIKLSTQGDSL